MKKLSWFVVCGLALLGACSSNNNDNTDAGAGITPTANGVFPSQGFLGANLRVEISGDATSWGSDATIDFGDGVTVSNIAVSSPTDLFCDVAIDPSATAGLRDVTVTSNGTFKLSQAFELQSPVTASFIGDLVQGTVVQVTINNHNFDAPFDASTTPTVAGPTGTAFNILSNDAYTVTAYMFVDVTATGGPITVTSDQLVVTTDAVTIAARTATPLTSGTAANGMIAAERDSGLYTISDTATDLLHFSLTTPDANAAPFIALLPASGSWLDELSGDYVLDTAGAYYAIVADNAAEGNYSFTLTGTTETPTVVAEGNDTTNGVEATAPTAATLPYEQSPSTMSSATDVDIIKFTVDAADANTTVHILTNAGSDALTDTAVELVDAAGNDYLSDEFGDVVIDSDSDCTDAGCSNGGEDVVSSALPAGTYYLEITAGADYATADKSYAALIWFGN